MLSMAMVEGSSGLGRGRGEATSAGTHVATNARGTDLESYGPSRERGEPPVSEHHPSQAEPRSDVRCLNKRSATRRPQSPGIRMSRTKW